MEEFALGHEYGHAVLGHNDQLRKLETDLGGKTVSYFERSREQEFEADAWAQDLLCGAFCELRPSAEFDPPADILLAAPAIFLPLCQSDRASAPGATREIAVAVGCSRVREVFECGSDVVRHTSDECGSVRGHRGIREKVFQLESATIHLHGEKRA
jgi:hypothetical protein